MVSRQLVYGHTVLTNYLFDIRVNVVFFTLVTTSYSNYVRDQYNHQRRHAVVEYRLDKGYDIFVYVDFSHEYSLDFVNNVRHDLTILIQCYVLANSNHLHNWVVQHFKSEFLTRYRESRHNLRYGI